MTTHAEAKASEPAFGSIDTLRSQDSETCGLVDPIQRFGAELAVLNNFTANVLSDKTGGTYGHALRSATILENFAGRELPKDVVGATLLWSVAKKTSDELYGRNASRALKAYGNERGDEEWGYTRSLLADASEIDRRVAERRQESAKMRALKGSPSELVEDKSTNIPREAWLEPADVIRPKELYELIEDVNLESALILAAHQLDDLNVADMTDSDLFNVARDVDAFYAPICEVIGLDGLAAALRSQSAIVRLEKAGYGSVIEKAHAILEATGDRETVIATVNTLLSELGFSDYDTDHAFEDTVGHGVHVGIGVLETPGSIQMERAIWRVKTPGSLALKILRNHIGNLKDLDAAEQRKYLEGVSELPADILGLTIVSKDTQDVAANFASMSIAAHDSEDVSFINSPGRSEALSIQGGQEFINSVLVALYSHSDIVDTDGKLKIYPRQIEQAVKRVKGAFQVAKFTCAVATGHSGESAIPAEVQVLTEAGRIAARTGLAAHILYKLKKQVDGVSGTPFEVTREDLSALQQLHSRKTRLGLPGINQKSLDRSRMFQKMLDRVGNVDLTARTLQRLLRRAFN